MGVRQSRRIANINGKSPARTLEWECPGCSRCCGESLQGNNFIVRREGLLILLHMSVGGSAYSSAGMGMGMGMVGVDSRPPRFKLQVWWAMTR